MLSAGGVSRLHGIVSEPDFFIVWFEVQELWRLAHVP